MVNIYEDVEMGNQVRPRQKWRHQEEGARKTCWNFPGKQKWFGYCLRRECNHICAKSLRLQVSGRRSRGRPKKRWWDNTQWDMKKYQLTESMAQDRKYWMTEIQAQGDGQGDGRERWERSTYLYINLRRSRDSLCVSVAAGRCGFVGVGLWVCVIALLHFWGSVTLST